MRIWQWFLVLICSAITGFAQRYVVEVPTNNQGIREYEPNGKVFTNTFIVSTTNTILDLNVILKMSGNEYCFNGDYYIALLHSNSGKRAVLLNRVGYPKANFGLGYGDNGINVTFDDQSTNGDVHLYGENLNLMGATLTGVWAPDGRGTDPANVKFEDPRDFLLSQFNGVNPSGTWMLFVADFGEGGSSKIEQWGLELSLTASTQPLEITKQAQNQWVMGGSNAVFEVEAQGELPLVYQWRFQGTNILTGTNKVLLIENAGKENHGSYDVIVTSGSQSMTNPPVNLTVLFQLTTNVIGNGLIHVLPSTNIFPAFTEISLKAMPNDGQIFAGWSGSITSSAPTLTFQIDSHMEVSALFNKAPIPLEIVKGPVSLSVLGGTNATFEVVAKGEPPITYQWRFQGTNVPFATNSVLLIDNTGIAHAGFYDVILSSGTQSMTNPPVQLTVLYRLINNSSPGGTVTVLPSTNVFPAMTEITLSAQADNGYVFDGWNGSITGTAQSLIFRIQSHMEVSALFKKSYTITTTALGQGTIDMYPAQNQYVENASVEINAKPFPGFVFLHWQGDLTGTTNPITLQINNTMNLSAVFVPALDPISDKRIAEGEPLTFTVSTNQSPVQFELIIRDIEGITLNSTNRLFSWTPTETQGPSTNRFELIARDIQNSSLSSTQFFTIFVEELNAKPQLVIPSFAAITAGQKLELNLTAADTDIPTNSLAFELVQGPSGASIDPRSGVLVWSTLPDHTGTNWDFTVRVTDNGTPPLSDEKSFSVEVKPAQPIVLKIERIEGFFAVKVVNGDFTRAYSLQSSTNLIQWNNIPFLKPDLGEVLLIDTNSISPRRFYRVISP